ncbi:Growth-regulating factor 2 [Linum grandiflorum]
MDFGVLGLQPVVAHHHHHPQSSSSSSPEQQQPSSVLPPPPPPPDSNLQRSDVVCCKPSKIPRTSTMSAGLLRSNSSSNMLSFSSTPYHHHYPPAPNTPGSLSGTMHGAAFTGFRGPFTPSQWMELEHQALIYKYLTANVAVPSNLLNPLKKSLYPFALSSSSSPASFIPGSLGWGAFHLGYPGSTNDPEPGRCRRTDGKKWRCSRDAVSDQKYCERHINRGRHRSRKPVEGQSGHGVSGTKLVVVPPPPQQQQQQQQMAASTSAITTNSAADEQQQLKNLQLQHQQANASR